MKEGIYPTLSNEEYHSNKSAISRSALMDFEKSPYHYWARHINEVRPQKEKTKSMEIGSAFHTLILEPHLFNELYAVRPRRVLLKDVGREAYEEFKRQEEELERSTKIILSEEDFQQLVGMQEKLLSNDIVVNLLEGARIEHSFFWQDDVSGLTLKSRPDILHDNMIIDLKTATDASPRAFQSELVKYGYHIQGAMVSDAVLRLEGKEIRKVLNIVVEKTYPYSVGIYLIDEYAIEEGRFKYKQLCVDLKSCMQENKWKDFGVQTISLPKWAI